MRAAAKRAFVGERRDLAERYANLLAEEGTRRGLIGPREAPRLWERHLLNCAAVAQVVPNGADVCDIGSGAGLPGIVLAIARPDLHVTLVEPLLRRAAFLEEAVEELKLTRIRVLRTRAEELAGMAATFAVVTARAVAPLPRLLEWSMPLVAPLGHLVAMKGARAADELAQAAGTLARLGCAAPELIELEVGAGLSTTRIVRVAHAHPARVSWRGDGSSCSSLASDRPPTNPAEA